MRDGFGMREIIMADQLGFCFGVRRAVDEITNSLADNAGKNGKNGENANEIWSIGMPIHSPQEVARLKGMGLKVVDSAAEVPDDAKVLIRAHGETRAVMDSLRARGIELTDATCPFVRKAQERAAELSSQGYRIVLLGNERHPEIRSIMGSVEAPIDVVAGVADAQKLPKMPRAALISQTTQQEKLLADVASVLVLKSEELHVCNTVCNATVERQEAVRRLTGKVDGVVVIGGKESANTAKLREIAAECGMDAFWIESIDDIDWAWLEGKTKIGIAAGASTPEWLIMKVKEALKNF